MWEKILALYGQINPRTRAYSPLIPVCIVLSCAWSAYQTFQAPVTYVSTGRIVVSGRINLADSNTYLEELNNFIGTQIEIIRSDSLAARARQQMLSTHPMLNGSVSIEPSWLRSTAIFMVKATGSDPSYTEAYLNALLQQYIESRSDRRIETSLDAMQKLREEILRVEKTLAEQEAELYRFKEQHNMVYWGRQSTDASQYLSELKIREASLELKLRLTDSLRSNPAALEAQRGGAANDGPAVPASVRDANVPALRRQLAEKEIERDQLLATYKPAHPRIKALDQEIVRQRRLLDLILAENEAALQAELTAARGELAGVRQSIQDWEGKAMESTRTEAEHEKLQSGLARSRELYSRLINNLQSVSVGKEVNVDPVQILQRASPAAEVPRPITQNLRTALGLGLLIGLVVAHLLGRIDPRAFSESEITTRLGTEALLEIPHIREIDGSPNLSGDAVPAALTESARTIMASLHLKPHATTGAPLLFCVSTCPGEGKSTVSLHLALHAAKSGVRTLLIDGDLRRGQLAERLGQESGAEGLAELLNEPGRGWRSVIRRLEPSGLDFMPRGRTVEKTVDQLNTWLTESNLAEMRATYGLVVIDASPLAPIADSTRFLRVVDRVLFITRLKTTPLRIAERVVKMIRSQQPAGFDLVINNSFERRHYGNYYETYQYR